MVTSKYIVCLIVIFCLFSCSKQSHTEKIKQQVYKQWLGKKLTIPDDIVFETRKRDIARQNKDTLSFVHYFNGSCVSCIYHIKNLKNFTEDLKKKNVKVFLIAYTNTPRQTQKIFNDAKLSQTIYIDSLNSLYFKNKFNSIHLESFLLGRKNQILSLGEINNKDFRKGIATYIKEQ